MATTIAVSDAVRRKLMILKQESGERSMDALLQRMLVEHRKLKLLEASALFNEKLRASGLRFEDLVK